MGRSLCTQHTVELYSVELNWVGDMSIGYVHWQCAMCNPKQRSCNTKATQTIQLKLELNIIKKFKTTKKYRHYFIWNHLFHFEIYFKEVFYIFNRFKGWASQRVIQSHEYIDSKTLLMLLLSFNSIINHSIINQKISNQKEWDSLIEMN